MDSSARKHVLSDRSNRAQVMNTACVSILANILTRISATPNSSSSP